MRGVLISYILCSIPGVYVIGKKNDHEYDTYSKHPNSSLKYSETLNKYPFHC
jgi:hypothetical protein